MKKNNKRLKRVIKAITNRRVLLTEQCDVGHMAKEGLYVYLCSSWRLCFM